ncbi:iron dicitrate transporter FecR [Marivirga lumbricoides]|uniref:Iron dicitrate transporter FecR n=1 Tax=Marivirga lumbricoides TaxID=1046115 RepID=A0ABQ1MYX8_9BACT|nr:iron dicitrate transporter FecR [Marivirga lumbricoides]
MNQKEVNEAWEAYLHQAATESDKLKLLKALESNKFNATFTNLFEAKWIKADKEEPEYDIRDGEILRKIKEEIKRGNELEKQNLFKRYFKHIAIAASVSLLLLTGISIYQNTNKQIFETFKVASGNDPVRKELPDGTIVWLNSSSNLQYQTDFVENRNIILNGEGYFEVAKNKNSPFRISFNGSDLLVTGTQFNLKSYSSDKHSTVHVKEGSVQVTSSGEVSNLKRNDELVINRSSGKFILQKDEFNHANSWIQNKLVFENTPLEEVLATLERSYNLKIALEKTDNQKNKILTATYSRHTELTEILDGLKYLENINYRFITQDSVLVNY